MKVYCVLEGGGVKGAGLAGALAAVEEREIEIIGYGGSSVGAIIATLGAAGFTGEEIGQVMKKRKFTQFLGSTGYRLLAIRYAIELSPLKIHKACSRQGGIQWLFSLIAWPAAIAFSIVLLPFHILFLGVYSGKKLVKTTLSILQEKYPDFSESTTFEEFDKRYRKSLRILTSDITYRFGHVFSVDHTPNMPVLDAIRASTGYPFVFRPFKYRDNQTDTVSHLLDGGITSNLPSHLFQKEYAESGINTLVLDLVQEKNKRRPAWHIFKLTSDIIGTALDSSDQIISALAFGSIHIPVKITNTVDALNFNLSESEREALFEEGKKSASAEIAAKKKIEIIKDAGDSIHRQLIKNHGPASAYGAVLAAIKSDIEYATSAMDVRVCVILPVGGLRHGGSHSLMVTYTAGFKGNNDIALELEEGEGATWDLWSTKDQDFIAVDQKNTEFNQTLPKHKQEKIPEDRKSLLAFKIFVQNLSNNEERGQFGILGIDSSTPLEDTGWIVDNDLVADIRTIISPWLEVIPLIMRGHLL